MKEEECLNSIILFRIIVKLSVTELLNSIGNGAHENLAVLR